MYKIRVFYEDTDAAGLVYYANYLKYIERARTQLLIDNNFSHTYLKDKFDIFLIVKSCNINYLKPAKLDNDLEIFTVIIKKSKVQLYLNQKILYNKKVITEANVRIVSINSIGKVVRMPTELFNIF